MITQFLHSLSELRLRHQTESSNKDLASRMYNVFVRTWDLGFTAFGGPAVHFQILHERFVTGNRGQQKWVDEQTVS